MSAFSYHFALLDLFAQQSSLVSLEACLLASVVVIAAIYLFRVQLYSKANNWVIQCIKDNMNFIDPSSSYVQVAFLRIQVECFVLGIENLFLPLDTFVGFAVYDCCVPGDYIQ